jgi:hypothetical protein
MKQVLYVSTAVLAFAFVFVLYLYVTVGKHTGQTYNKATAAKPGVEQRWDGMGPSFLNQTLFGRPTVKPPLRVVEWPLVARSSYTDLNTKSSYSGLSPQTTSSETMALNANHSQVQSR